jgi:hypothetical protein
MISNVQINHLFRLLSQNIIKPEIAIIGGYHGVNLGDMALGISVNEVLKKKKIKSGLQTIYNLDRFPWPLTKYAIIGGGAVGYIDSLKKVAHRYQDNNSKVCLLGVDYNDIKYEENEKIFELLKQAKAVSCRSRRQAEKMSNIIGRKDISFHPDLTFSYQQELCCLARKKQKQKLLLVNIVPLYGTIQNKILLRNETYKKERPELYKGYDTMVEGYKRGIRTQVQQALQNGYEVETIPFTPADYEMAKLVLKGIRVKHNLYSDNPQKMLQKMAKTEKVIATRYHATIFAMKVGAKVLPIAYARKNEHLLEDFGKEKHEYITTTDLANGEELQNNYLEFNEQQIVAWEQNCEQFMIQSVEQLIG